MQREVQAKIMTSLGRKITRISASIIVCIVICFSSGITALAQKKNYTNQDIADIIQGIVSWKEKSEDSDGNLFSSDFVKDAGSSASDWYAVAFGRIGAEQDYSSYLAMLKSNVRERYSKNEKLDNQKSTEWHRIALAVLSLGGDPVNFGQDSNGDTIDLIRDGTYDRGKTNSLGAQGINGYIWGLITLDSMRYIVPQGAFESRRNMITEILKNQLADGGFTLDGSIADVDITAMALQALAPYYNDEEIYTYKTDDERLHKNSVRQAADNALEWLSSVQNDDGDFEAWGEQNAESTVQVMTALCSLGIDPENDSRFIKDGSVLDGLMKYRMKDGGFAHCLNEKKSENKSNQTASQQALYGLCAFYRYRTDLRSLYDFRPEQSQKLKEKIKFLNKKLGTPVQDKEDALECLSEYISVPITERSYVYNYHNLAKAMKEFKIENTSQSLVDAMDQNTGGKGTVINIFDGSDGSTGLVWSEKDTKEYQSLPEKLTNEQYFTVVRLYEKLTQAENLKEHTDILADLTKKKNEVSAVHAEIEDINEEIAQKLYPFDGLSENDKSAVDNLISRVEALEKCDRKQILGLEDLYKAKAKIDTSCRSMIILIVTVVLILICIALILLRIRKRKIKRKEESDFSDNQDW